MKSKRWFAMLLCAIILCTTAAFGVKNDDALIQKEGYVYIPNRSVYFADVDESMEWAFREIDYLANSKVVSGTADCVFSPNAPLKRADFVLMLYKAYGMSSYAGGANFADVPETAYYANAVSAARNLGIVYGDENGRFNPNASLTRQDAMVMLRRTLDKTGLQFSGGSLSAFRDAGSVAAYARNDVSALVDAKVISGSNGVLRPGAKVSRAEMAIMLYRALMLEPGEKGPVYVESTHIVNLCVGGTIYSHVTIKNEGMDKKTVGLYECKALKKVENGYEVTLGAPRELDQEIAWSKGALLVNGVSVSVAEGCEAVCIEPYGVLEGIPATGGIYKAAAVSFIDGMVKTIYYAK